MGFLAPWFLAGLAAVGLPVWLHLLKKHRSTPLPFSSLMFFERRTQSSIKHRRLQYLLLFALRTALVALLVLAFAQPFIQRAAAPAAGGRELVLLALDHSFSMRQGNRLARAKSLAEEQLSRLGAADRAQVLALGAQVRMTSDATNDRAALRAAIESVEPGDARGSYAELARALRSLAQAARTPVEAHLFSDMQKSSLPANFTDLALAEGVTLVPHPVVDARAPNFALDNVKAPGHVYDPRHVRVQATVAGYGTQGAARRVTLVLNGREVEAKTVDVPAGGRAEAEFLSLDVPHGLNRGEVRIDGGDAFPADDRFYFAIERSDPRPALFVHEPQNARAALYFRAALESATQPAFTLDAVTADRSAGLSPSKYAFVALSDVASLPASFENALKDYVRSGGSVLVAAGSFTAVRRRVPVTGQAIPETLAFSREADRFQAAAWLDPAHPATHGANWDGVKFYQAARVDPAGAQVLARLAGDIPLLLETRLGQGRVLVFASTFDNIANDFPLHTGFVPFVEQAAAYLGRLDERPANLMVDAWLELRRGREQGAAAEVTGPGGRRVLSLEEATRAQNLRLAAAGFYDVKRPDGRRELVAVNADRRESDLDIIPAETLALWQNTGQGSRTAEGAAQEQERKPFGLWWYAMLAALVLVLAESLLANRYLGVDREPAEKHHRAAGKEAA